MAAVVFTDVAGFSTAVETNEAATLALVDRDFLTMRLFSSMLKGTVIKSTGDGLLLYFTSAVQAVEWALKTQRHFADQATNLPAAELLKHRIGIHVGEIILNGGDVMGDGVNVAARVQAEARPGGICITDVAYGVVKKKMKLDVVRLETRKLKNIDATIQLYHVLLEAPSAKAATEAPFKPAAEVVKPKTAVNLRNWLIGIGSVVVVGVVTAMLFLAQREHEAELTGSQGLRQALGAALRADETPVEVKVAPVTPATSGQETAKTAPTPVVEEINFLKLTTSKPAGRATAAQQSLLQKAQESMKALEAWRPGALERWTKGQPLAVKPLSATTHQTWTVFTDASHQLYFAEGGAVRKREWADLTSDVQGAIVASLFMNSPVPVTRDVVRGAEAFAYVNGLPELADKLVR